MRDIEPNQHVVGILPHVECLGGGRPHIGGLRLASGHDISATDVISLMDAGRDYFMVPPPGSSAYEASVAAGLPLILQSIECPVCGTRMLFA